MSSDEGILVIEWTAYDVVSLQHIPLAWISLDGRSCGPNMINRLVVPCPGNQLLLSLLSLYHSDTDPVPINPDHVPINPYS